jgi:hypothetical protein
VKLRHFFDSRESLDPELQRHRHPMRFRNVFDAIKVSVRCSAAQFL